MDRGESQFEAGSLVSLALQNQTLRIIIWSVLAGSALVIIPLLFLLARPPLVVGLANGVPEALEILGEANSLQAAEVKAFLFELFSQKYPKNPGATSSLSVCRFFGESIRGGCEKELSVKRPFVSQDIVVDDLTWNEARGIAEARIKRFANLAGTIASIETNLKINLSKQTRSKENPWGIFVTSWNEEVVK